MALQVRVLGSFAVGRDDSSSAPKASKPRQLLAILAVNSGSVLQLASLTEELWGGEPPPSASAIVQNYVMQLRKFLATQTEGTQVSVRDLLRTHFGGYSLNINRELIDAVRFEGGVDRGRRAFEAGEPEAASELLKGSLALWKGPVLADVQQGPLLTLERVRLEELRLHAQQLLIESEMKLGHYRQVISDLQALIAKYPHHEGLYELLMLALYHSGRRMNAISVYRDLYKMFGKEFGLVPAPSLRELHQFILRSEQEPELENGGSSRGLLPPLSSLVQDVEQINLMVRSQYPSVEFS
jgi:SARP family transcriptional regulator, regulator of embCAB operon